LKKLLFHRSIEYYQIENSSDLEKFQLREFRFFKGLGIVDYQQTFKAWLKKFPRPLFIAAIHNHRIAGWVHIDTWPEGKARDGNPVFVLRAIETSPDFRRKQIGRTLVYLALKHTLGYMLTKPVTSKSSRFFKEIGFQKPWDIASIQIDLSRYSNHVLLTPAAKKRSMAIFEETLEIQKGPLSNVEISMPGLNDPEEQVGKTGALDGKRSVEGGKPSGPEPTSVENSVEKRNRSVRSAKDGKEEKMDDHTPGAKSGRLPDSKKVPNKGDDYDHSVIFLFDTSHELHKSSSWSPENPRRVTSILEAIIEKRDNLQQHLLMQPNTPAASFRDLSRVHKPDYINFVKSYCESGGGFLGEDVYFTQDTYFVATVSAGSAIQASKEVLAGKAPFAFACTRPPGHHAKTDKQSGYCIFNNAAIVARYLQAIHGMKRIMIVDWDAHAANGTMEIFYNDPSVLLVSMQQDPHDFYPFEGLSKQLGKGPGLGSIINIEMPRSSGDAEYRIVFNEIVWPLYHQYKPDFVICCCGFDPYHLEDHTQLSMTSQGFHNIGSMVGEHLSGKVVTLLEGGYTRNLGHLVIAYLEGMTGQENHFKEDFDILSSQTIQQEKCRKVLRTKLNELRLILKEFYEF